MERIHQGHTGGFQYAVLDFDGTISLVREGWQGIMVPYFIDELGRAPGAKAFSDEEISYKVRDFVTVLTGKQTIYQCIRLAEEITALGGTPEEVPERFEASSPLTYVDAVRAPVYISAGVNDPRCPIRQVENYVERLAARDAVHEVYRYDAGHGSLVVEERIKQVRLELEFALKHLGGGAVQGA